MLEELDKASVEYQIDTDNNRFNLYKQDNSTKFIISYNPKCEMKDEQQLKMKNWLCEIIFWCVFSII